MKATDVGLGRQKASLCLTNRGCVTGETSVQWTPLRLSLACCPHGEGEHWHTQTWTLQRINEAPVHGCLQKQKGFLLCLSQAQENKGVMLFSSNWVTSSSGSSVLWGWFLLLILQSLLPSSFVNIPSEHLCFGLLIGWCGEEIIGVLLLTLFVLAGTTFGPSYSPSRGSSTCKSLFQSNVSRKKLNLNKNPDEAIIALLLSTSPSALMHSKHFCRGQRLPLYGPEHFPFSLAGWGCHWSLCEESIFVLPLTTYLAGIGVTNLETL